MVHTVRRLVVYSWSFTVSMTTFTMRYKLIFQNLHNQRLLFCVSVKFCLLIFVQRNYRFFFMFICCATLLCLYVHGFCWVYIKRIMNSEHTSIWKAMIKTPASIVLIAYTFIAFWFVGGLTFFHLYLIGTNQVTSSFFILLLGIPSSSSKSGFSSS